MAAQAGDTGYSSVFAKHDVILVTAYMPHDNKSFLDCLSNLHKEKFTFYYDLNGVELWRKMNYIKPWLNLSFSSLTFSSGPPQAIGIVM
jgi:hypothetical protein